MRRLGYKGSCMKFIHSADIHLGSKINSLPKTIADSIKSEIRKAFIRMVDYAKQQNINVIVLAGDVFDSDSPFKKDKEFFYDVVEANQEIDFLYLRGNHDSVHYSAEMPKNLKTFSDTWSAYSYGDTRFWGLEMTNENCTSFYSTLALPKDGKNIVILHGNTTSSMGKIDINLSKLKNKNIDYLALGHYHTYTSGVIDARGCLAYSGCLVGRGFDEIGKKGFLVIDTEDDFSRDFIPCAQFEIVEKIVNISGSTSAYEACLKVENALGECANSVVQVLLVGELDEEIEDLAKDVEDYLSNRCAYVQVKDHTTKKINIHAYDGDVSIRGEFVRSVYADDSLSDEDKVAVISLGLKALRGEKLQ